MFDFTKSRNVVANDLLNEFERLAATGNTPSITNPTNSGRVKELKAQVSEDKLNAFLEQLGREYKKQTEKEIKKSSYKKKPDEKKKDSLDQIKTNIIDKLLPKYGYKKPKT